MSIYNQRLTDASTSAGLEEGYGIIAFSHLRWNFVWQRPQQFLSRFAESNPILFVEEPEFTLEPGELPRVSVEQADKNITVARMLFPHGCSRDEAFYQKMRDLTRDVVASLNDGGAFDAPLLWFYNPMDSAWAIGYFNESGVAYDCMDELSQFKNPPIGLIENERNLIENADIIFTGGYELWLKKSKQHDNVHFFGCGVEYDHFAKAQLEETAIPDDVKNIPSPILGWFGVIDERMDYPLVAEMAAQRPDWNFVIVGPVVKVDPKDLPQASNIYWLGQKDYKELPSYCKAFDICMMCFALNEATEFINPTKALEYLATGREVIGTPVRDVVRQYDEVVHIASTPEEFIAHAERALAQKDEARIKKGTELAQSKSWESTVEEMRRLIAEAAHRRVRAQAATQVLV